MTVEFTPWNKAQFADLVIWHNTDRVLAEHTANAAIDADSDDDCRHEVAMTELYALRARVFAAPNLAAIARSSAHIEAQTCDAMTPDPRRPWPADRAAELLTAWRKS